MGKTRRKNHSEVEHLRGEVKKLKSTVRSLERRNKELERKSHFFEEVVEEATDQVEMQETCNSCGKGTLIMHDFVHMILKKCDLCGDQQRIAKNGSKAQKSSKT